MGSPYLRYGDSEEGADPRFMEDLEEMPARPAQILGAIFPVHNRDWEFLIFYLILVYRDVKDTDNGTSICAIMGEQEGAYNSRQLVRDLRPIS